MALRPLEDIIGPLVLPIRGKEYTLPSVSAEDALKVHASRTSGAPLEASELYRIVLGDAHQELVNDLVGGDIIDRVFLTAYTDFTAGRESAEEVWENGVPKAMREAAKEVLALMATKPTAEPAQPTKARGKAKAR